jgi:hypothetical protein
MFDLVKQQVNLLQEIEKDLGVAFRAIGEKNWRIDGDKDVESCPFCDHHDCFRVKYEEGDNGSSFYKCFSCGEHGDVISWRAKRKGITVGEASKQLAKEAGIRIPNDYNPVQQIFNLAADYYHNCLADTCNKPYSVLNGLSPIRYQTEVRKHKRETLDKFKIGYSDGGLIEYLDSMGLDRELIAKSGLVNKSGKDFLPTNCFIYPHFVKGRVSHFTFKDPLKRVQYQLPKKYSLNGYLFYGQDHFQGTAPIFLVEGENDLLSCAESSDAPAAMAIIGQISTEQLEWLKAHGREKNVISLFDPDEAGDGYRRKLEAIRKFFKGLLHVLPPEGKDIDDHLTGGGSFLGIVKGNMVKVSLEAKKVPTAGDTLWAELSANAEPVTYKEPTELAEPVLSEGMTLAGSAPSTGTTGIQIQDRIPAVFGTAAPVDENIIEAEDGNVIQRAGKYFKIVKDKDGIPKEIKLSNFTIELVNVYENDMFERTREVIVIREDGYRSKPVIVDSRTKVNVMLFKVLIAQYTDCEWLGKEGELDAMWRIVYSKAPDVLIRVLGQVGKYEEQNCWVFKNLLITGSGVAVEPDSNGVFWPTNRTRGIKPISISGSEDRWDVPSLGVGMSRDESNQLLGEVLKGFTKVLKSPGAALMALGWTHSNVYSNEIFKFNGGMGSLMFWGIAGKGKSTMGKWVQKFYGVGDKMASTSVQQMRTPVGFLRKAEYYASLPMFLDELRADEKSLECLGMIRSWYDREGRTMADKLDSKKVVNQKIRATLMIGGEDLPDDPATKERCILVRVPPSNNEDPTMKDNYDKMEGLSENFSNITYFWILDSCNEDKKEIMTEIRKIDRRLVENGCSNRISKVWAGAAYFALKMAEVYYPDFDFVAWLVKASSVENASQKGDTTLSRFWIELENLQGREDSPISDGHVSRDMRDPNLINIWYQAVFKEVNDRIRESDKRFSKHAILHAMREESYFISEDRKVNMGMLQTRRTVVTLDLTKAPDYVRNLVGFDK